MFEYLRFSLLFMLIHAGAYMIAGALILRVSSDIYEGKSRLMDYLNDMSVAEEAGHVTRWFLPGNLLRGLLLSLVLYPILTPLGELDPILRFLFFFGLAFVYTHIGSAAPCPDNIEGLIYMKRKYLSRSGFLKFQSEMLLYSLIFAAGAAWLLF
ncbi:hypothetical protein J2T58_001327 [Methanocalculus alkaliphilus]|uniref:hypothetical protein n=1 Tax=Methanocalculus alkaliphilus TaxID=768730 RepID=UPI00209D47BE|nr:hypothetical protein [Methanocalculus alkaliphilus]MCP1715462.1 hypothetical protein [Methanocalculus alkaliphilus]